MWLRDWRNSLQQHVEALGFRDQHRRAQQFADAARPVVLDHAAQQVLGQQDAEDLVLVLAMHREARVAGFDHLPSSPSRNLPSAGSDTICARGTITSATVRSENRDRAFDHPQRVGGDQAVGLCVARSSTRFLAVARLARQGLAQSIEPGTWSGAATTGILGHC
jgi:hypothetical protein